MIPLIPIAGDKADPMDAIKKMVEEPSEVMVLAVTSPINYFALYVNTLKNLLQTDLSGLCITFNRSSKALEDVMRKQHVDTSRLYFVDCISKASGVEDKTIKSEYADSPSALSSISMAITEKLGQMGDKKFILFDSITTLLIYNELANVLQFMDYIVNRMRDEDVKTIIFAVEEGDPRLINHLMQSCDRVYRI
jgi:archaellum biogenesis ATPase FlaH